MLAHSFPFGSALDTHIYSVCTYIGVNKIDRLFIKVNTNQDHNKLFGNWDYFLEFE